MPSSPASEAEQRDAAARPPTQERAAEPRGARELRRARARAARGPLQARARRPRQLPQARRRARSSAASRRRSEALLRDWLEAVDSVERALRMAARRPARPRGCGRCSSRWRRSSPARACTRIGAAGEPFDPERHEAVARARDRRGARPHGRRGARARASRSATACCVPAQVVVARAGREPAALMAVGFRDYYEALGVPRDASEEDIRARLPQARAPVPPRRQQGARARRTASRRSPRPTRSCATPRSASATTASGANWRGRRRTSVRRARASAAVRAASARRRRLRRRPRRVRRAAATSATSSRACSARRAAGGGRGAASAASTASRCAAATRRPSSSSRSRRPRAAAGARISLGDGRDYEVDIPPRRARRPAHPARRRGRRGRGGGPPGDLFLRVRIRPHPRFRVEGRDLYVDLPVAPWEAALGAEVEVADARRQRAREGPAGLVQRPPAAPARRRACRTRAAARGDLYATVKIMVPKKLTHEGARAVRAARRRSRSSTRGGALMAADGDPRDAPLRWCAGRPARARATRSTSTRSRARPACTPSSCGASCDLGLLDARRRHGAAPRFRRDAAATLARAARLRRDLGLELRRRGARVRAAGPHRRTGGAAAPLRAPRRTPEVMTWIRTS